MITEPCITDAHVAKRVKRLEKRRQEQLPLFATVPEVLEQIEPTQTAGMVREDLERRQQAVLDMLKAHNERWSAEAFRRRAHVARCVTSEELQVMDAYVARTYPPDPLYAAEYWWGQAQKLGVEL